MTSIDALEFRYEILNHLFDDSELNIESLFQKDEKYEIENQDGVILNGFFLDGGKWNRENNIILDSPLRFTALPHFFCRIVKVIK